MIPQPIQNIVNFLEKFLNNKKGRAHLSTAFLYIKIKNIMRILITGANGQLGQCFINEVRQQKVKNDYYFTDVLDLDITEKKSIENYVAEKGIDIIVNCAAYTNVEKAEEISEKDKVYDINCKGVQNLAEVCSDRELFLIQISTDFTLPFRASDAAIPAASPSVAHVGIIRSDA